MTDYTKTTNFAAKDNLVSGNPAKVVKGSEIDTEYNNIAVAIATKSNIASPTFTGTVTIPTVDINAGNIDGTIIGASSAAAGTFTSVTTSGNVTVGGNLTVTGNAVISGNLTFGDADTDNISFAADVNSNILPNIDDTYDLGSSTKEWRNLYIDGTANIDSLVADTADINGGTLDGVVIGGSSAAAGTFTTATATTGNITTVNATTVDSTNVEVTNLKAKDGTASATIADVTGVMTVASAVLTTADINGGTADAVVIGGATPAAGTFTSLNATGGGALTGTWSNLGSVTTIDINGGTIDGAVIGGSSAAAGSFTTISASGTITGPSGTWDAGGVDIATGDTYAINSVDVLSATTLGSSVVNSSLTSLGTITSLVATTADINGGTIDGAVIGGASAAAITGTTITGTSFVSSGNMTFADNAKAIFGAGNDLEIYHDTNGNSFINESGSGSLFIQGENIRFRNNALSTYALFTTGGATSFYYNNAAKLATTATGIDVTGTITADGLTVDGAAQFNTGAAGVAEFYHSSGQGGLRVTGSSTGSASTIFLSNDKTGTPFDIYSFWGNGGDDSLEFFSGGSPSTGTKRLRLANNGDISFYEDTGTTAKFFWDASTEFLGIGTSSPSYKLQVDSGSTDASALFNSTSANGSHIRFASSGTVKNYIGNAAGFITSGSADDLGLRAVGKISFATNGAAADMTLDSSGNLLVGATTSLASETLRVNGNTNTSGAGVYPVTGVISDARAYNSTAPNAGGGLGFSYKYNAAGSDAVGPIIQGYKENTTDGNYAGGLRFFTRPNGANPAERLRIDSSGNVGIGDSSPASYNALGSARNLVLGSSGGSTITITSGASSYGHLAFATGTATDSDEYRGLIQYYHADNSMRLYTNAAERLRLDSSGNVGIGTSSPVYLVHAYGLNADIAAHDSGANGTRAFLAATNSAIYLANTYSTSNVPIVFGSGWGGSGVSSEYMRIDSSGNVLLNQTNSFIGTNTSDTADNKQLILGGGGAASILRGAYITLKGNEFATDAGSIAYVTGKGSANHLWFDGDSASERMRIDSSGNLLVGRTSTITFSTNTTDGVVLWPSRIDLSAASLCRISQVRDATGTYDRFYNGANIVGSITCTTSATAYNTSSDQRIKENIADSDDAGSKIDSIQVRQFDWKVDGSHQDYGMIAQELVTVAPEAVHQPEDPEEMMGVDYSKLVPMLVKEIQSLRARVAQLEGSQ